MRSLLPLAPLVGALLLPVAGITQTTHVFLDRSQIESAIVGKTILSKNLASGKLSHWEFRTDGTVTAVSASNGAKASGTWSLKDDGRMCVSMVGRTGCRYWFKNGSSYANSDTKDPEARTVAEVEFE